MTVNRYGRNVFLLYLRHTYRVNGRMKQYITLKIKIKTCA